MAFATSFFLSSTCTPGCVSECKSATVGGVTTSALMSCNHNSQMQVLHDRFSTKHKMYTKHVVENDEKIFLSIRADSRLRPTLARHIDGQSHVHVLRHLRPLCRAVVPSSCICLLVAALSQRTCMQACRQNTTRNLPRKRKTPWSSLPNTFARVPTNT